MDEQPAFIAFIVGGTFYPHDSDSLTERGWGDEYDCYMAIAVDEDDETIRFDSSRQRLIRTMIQRGYHIVDERFGLDEDDDLS